MPRPLADCPKEFNPEDEMSKTYDIDHEAEHWKAVGPDLLDVCRSVIADYEDTFTCPEEMSGEWNAIYQAAKAAVAKVDSQKLPEDVSDEIAVADTCDECGQRHCGECE